MVKRWQNLSLMFHQKVGHAETEARLKISSERPEKRGIDLAIPVLVVQCNNPKGCFVFLCFSKG